MIYFILILFFFFNTARYFIKCEDKEALQALFGDSLSFTKTQRGRVMLVYKGYKYVENRQSSRHIFWRCSRYVKYKCRATLVTTKDASE